MKTAQKVPQEIINALGLGTIGILGLLYVAVLILVRAWCITKLWAWFVVPMGLPAIGLLAAIGLTMTISVVMGSAAIECYQGRYRSLNSAARVST